jgi:hypothetical protein
MKAVKGLVALAVIAGTLVGAQAAQAWSGAKVVSVSCPEIHVVAPPEQGPWRVWLTEGDRVVFDQTFPGAQGEQVIGGFYESDALTHTGLIHIANAANPEDGLVVRPYQVTNCAAPPAPAPVTITNTIDRTVTIIQQVPAPPQVCTSNRTIKFLVRQRYPGASNAEGNPVLRIDRSKVGKVNGKIVGRGVYTGLDADGKVIRTTYRVLRSGRIQVTIEAAGHRFNPYANDLRTTVWLDTGAHTYRTLYVSATCRSTQGNPNDQRARTVNISG